MYEYSVRRKVWVSSDILYPNKIMCKHTKDSYTVFHKRMEYILSPEQMRAFTRLLDEDIEFDTAMELTLL